MGTRVIGADENELDVLHEEIMKAINVMYVGSIDKINSDGTLDVKVSLRRSHNGEDTSNPVLLSVPMVGMFNGVEGILLPMKTGDLVTLVFSSRRIDEGLAKKDPVKVHGFFDMNQCVAIPNVSLNTVSSDVSITGEDLQIINKNGNIKITGKTVVISAESVVIGAEKLEIFAIDHTTGMPDPSKFVNLNGMKIEGTGSLTTVMGNLGAPITFTPTPSELIKDADGATPPAPPAPPETPLQTAGKTATGQANMKAVADGSLKSAINANYVKLNAQPVGGTGSVPNPSLATLIP